MIDSLMEIIMWEKLFTVFGMVSCAGYEEFKKAMKEMKFDEGNLQALFRFFDSDCNGFISYNEFITGLRGQLNDRRRELVFMAYKVCSLVEYVPSMCYHCISVFNF